MIQVEMKPEVEQRVMEAAMRRGLNPGEYVSRILADTVGAMGPTTLTTQEFKSAVDLLVSHGAGLTELPDRAYTRESFYEDHD